MRIASTLVVGESGPEMRLPVMARFLRLEKAPCVPQAGGKLPATTAIVCQTMHITTHCIAAEGADYYQQCFADMPRSPDLDFTNQQLLLTTNIPSQLSQCSDLLQQ